MLDLRTVLRFRCENITRPVSRVNADLPLLHHRCLRDLTPDRVLQAVASLMQAEAPRASAPAYA